MMLSIKVTIQFNSGMADIYSANLWKIYEEEQKPYNCSRTAENNKGRIYSNYWYKLQGTLVAHI